MTMYKHITKLKRQGAQGGYARCILATQHDSNDEAEVADGFLTNGGDNVEVVTEEGTVVLQTSCLAQVITPLRVKRVNDTNTTATSVWLVYANSDAESPD